MGDVTVPVDQLHADCVAARAAINACAEIHRQRIARWEPAPCPPQPERTRR